MPQHTLALWPKLAGTSRSPPLGSPQRTLFYQLSLETFVPPEHPLRAIRTLIEDAAIRRACRDLCSPMGRPSIPPEQMFLALVGGYLLGITSERKLMSLVK